ncbi:DoxX family protein [Aeromicrobium sp. Root236]|uniref:DoxX family protein n=1 Tax=Aeromicrobium sp. Root236 TaxID=1736498 RepID=UPI0006FD6884|nr:DoxX family protein [Aeromicrobium sp. Root236]KRC64467.1 DoxX family protein [Aeromicrobium sp. Root236]
MNELDTASLILRLAIGVTLMAHGWNHGFGPGGLKGTAGWFESIGLRPAKVHAAVSSYLELAAGAALLVGFLVPFAAAAGVGIMTVAFMTVHRKNGFFIFREGEGYEYVMTIAFALTALAVLGGGQASLDHALDLDLDGVAIGLGAAAAGILGAAGMLVTSWRPSRTSD